MSITSTRILSAVLLFIVTMIAGILSPVLLTFWRRRSKGKNSKSNRWINYRNIMKIAMFFGGGVLLATCFIHLIPEVRENLHHYFERQDLLLHNLTHSGENGSKNESIEHHHHHHHHEEDVTDHPHHHHDEDHHHHEDHNEAEGSDEHHDHHHHNHTHGLPHVELAVCVGFFIIYLLEELVHTCIGHHSHDSHDDDDDLVKYRAKSISKEPIAKSYSSYTIDDGEVDQRTSFRGTENAGFNGSIETCYTVSKSKSIDPLPLPDTLSRSIDASHNNTPPPSVRFMQGLVIIIAFSAHSVFDGVAIGLQEEERRLWTMFFAICSHKLVVALAVGEFRT